ncbi:MAG: hypothetical protein ACYTFV_08760 [Planctomycetota bacterium]|jgi:hypothetical protein
MQLPPRAFLTGLAATALFTTTALAQDTGWAHLSPWTPENTVPTDGFGQDVCVEGEWAFMGSNGRNRVDVWRRMGATWEFFQSIENPIPGEHLFGMRLEVEDGVLYAGQPFSDVGEHEAGAVLQFEFDGDAWVHTDSIVAKHPIEFDNFGQVLDVEHDWMVTVGDKFLDSHRVHVLRKVDGQWEARYAIWLNGNEELGTDLAVFPNADGETATLFASDPQGTGEVRCVQLLEYGYMVDTIVLPENPEANAGWGQRLEYDGEHLVVAAPNATQLGQPTGAVSIYDVDTSVFPTVVTLAETVYPEANQIDSKFGSDLELEDGRLAIGAYRYQANEVQQPGAVFIYRPDIFFNGWSLEARLLQENADHLSQVGFSVALDGDYLLSGTRGANQMKGEGTLFSLKPQSMVGGQAAADFLATVETYGEGKPGSYGIPEFHCSTAPIPGDTALMGVDNVPQGTLPIVAWGAQPAETPFDGGTLLVDPLQLIVFPLVGPLEQVGWAWDIEADTNFLGKTVYAQAFIVDPGAQGVFQTAQSLGLALTVGY